MIGSKDNDCILIQSHLFQCFQNLTESTVHTGYGGEIIAGGCCLLHLQIYIRANQQTIQRLVFIKIEILFLAVIQRTVRAVRRIHTYHNKERFLGIAYVTVIFQIRNNPACFMQGRPFFRIMSLAIRIPIMRVLMFIKCTVRIPVIKTMTTFFRSISIPCRTFLFHILSRMFGIVRSWEVGMKFAEIGTVVTCLTEYIANTFRIFA